MLPLLKEHARATQESFAASDRRDPCIELAPRLWQRILSENNVPRDGIIIEVAPGYEPKIGTALSLLGFRGTLIVVEPDPRAARHLLATYRELLPRATVRRVVKPLKHIWSVDGIPRGINALVASHPFDDMVMASLVPARSFFSDERDNGSKPSALFEDVYGALTDEDYTRGVQNVVAEWERAIQTIAPCLVIVSQYPSRTLAARKLSQRQQSGFAVLEKLRETYRPFLASQSHRTEFGYKGNPRWWLVIKRVQRDDFPAAASQPAAMGRLGAPLFVPEQARRLSLDEYDIAYGDRAVIADAGIRDLAIVLDPKASPWRAVTSYADRQKDRTDIALKGNFGSGRAVYFGGRYNIIGVGRTSLCQSGVSSHRTGRLELIGAMRRVVMSRWINRFAERAPVHAALIALRDEIQVKWNQNPIPLSLLVRLDDGDLDRPSHVEQLPDIPVDLGRLTIEYARLDAECFAYRLLVGAWSTSNYSLNGRIIDLETASFVSYRGPYYTATAKYPHNRFGYEGLGLLNVLRQLEQVKKVARTNTAERFHRERRKHLGLCLLLLLGVEREKAERFFVGNELRVASIAREFERLTKKIVTSAAPFNLYEPRDDADDPTPLDAANLLRNIARLYGSPHAVQNALACLIRPAALRLVGTDTPARGRNRAEEFLARRAVVSLRDRDRFIEDTRRFASATLDLIERLDVDGCLDKKVRWDERLQIMNQRIPTMFELNETLKALAESYRLGRLSAKALRTRIDAICGMP